MAEGKAKSKLKGEKYRYLRLPLASAEEAEARRKYLIGIGTIVPVSERYSCNHGFPVTGYSCPECGDATVVWA